MELDDDLDEMSEDTPEVAVAEAPSPQDTTYWRKRAEKAEKQAVERKLALRRLEVASKHSVDATIIPEWVPADKLDEFAGNFLAKRESADTPQTDKATETVPEAGPTPQEQRLAAVQQGAQSATPAGSRISHDEYQRMVKDPATHVQAINARQAGLVDD